MRNFNGSACVGCMYVNKDGNLLKWGESAVGRLAAGQRRSIEATI